MKISNSEEIKNIAKSGKIPRISGNEIKISYANDIWDGPLEGICLWKGKKYYFYCVEDDPKDYETYKPGFPRRFVLIDLTSEQIKEEEYWKDLFDRGIENFYELSKSEKEFPINLNRLVGWFTLK